MNSARRVMVIWLGLVVAGALFGALAGTVALTLSLLITEKGTASFGIFGAVFGAPLGAVAAPAAAWLFLRRVPLGLLFAGSVVGTVFGGVAGWLLPLRGEQEATGLLGAIAGFGLSTLWMWSRTRARVAPTD